MKLVDSLFLVDYARGEDATVTYLIAHDDEVIGVSTIVLSELYRGLMLTQDMIQEEAMSKCEWVEPVPFTNETAAEAAEIYAKLRTRGEMLNKSDIYIAATARPLDVPLVVGDNHLDAVEELDVETYRE